MATTPALVGKRTYLMSNHGMENEFVQALSTEDEEPIWTRVGNVGNPDQNPPCAKARSTQATMVALDKMSGAVIWKSPIPGGDPAEYTSAIIVRGAVEFITGKVKWKAEGFGGASVTCADGQLYFHNENGDVRLVEADAKALREKGRFTPPAPPKQKTAACTDGRKQQ